MTRFYSLFIAFCCAALSAGRPSAEPLPPPLPLTGTEFQAIVEGRVLSFSAGGAEPFGVEKYLTGRRVIWSALDGNCETGRWYEEAENICFVYETSPLSQCWRIFAEGDGLQAYFVNDPGSPVLYETGDGAALLVCNGAGS